MIAIILGVILSNTDIATIHFVYPLALVAAYAFLSIRLAILVKTLKTTKSI